jgi:hypothetical protein
MLPILQGNRSKTWFNQFQTLSLIANTLLDILNRLFLALCCFKSCLVSLHSSRPENANVVLHNAYNAVYCESFRYIFLEACAA